MIKSKEDLALHTSSTEVQRTELSPTYYATILQVQRTVLLG
jgi:hypothetical protein